MLVQVRQRFHYLKCVALYFEFVKSLAALNKIVKRKILANLEQYVDVLFVFKEVKKFADKLVLYASVDFDLRHQLLLGAIGERGLFDKFACKNHLCFFAYKLVALCKAPLA
jgi:hypothetical protein